MKNSQFLISSVVCSALALGCSKDPGNDTKVTATNNTMASNPSGDSESGSDTSATGGGSATTGGGTGDGTEATSTPNPTEGGTGGTTMACSFLGCPTDTPPIGDCDVWAQDCDEGQKCVAWADDGGSSWNNVHCVDAPGDGQPGDVCLYDGIAVGSDDCAKGSMCWGTDENNMGTCVQQCTGTMDAPMCPNGPCTVANDGTLILCLAICDPLLQDCVGADLCIPNGDNFVCVLDAGGEEGQAFDPCEFANVCDAGLVCLDPATGGMGCDAAAGGCCSPFCEFPDGACPGADQKCVQWFDPAQLPAGDPKLDIGVCAIPA